MSKSTTTPRQLEILAQQVLENSDLVFGLVHRSVTKEQWERLWTRLAEKLNLYGPPIRNWFEWNSVWNGYKANLKRKVARVSFLLNSTKSKFKGAYFTEREEELIKLLGLRERVKDGIRRGRFKRFNCVRKPDTGLESSNEALGDDEKAAQSPEVCSISSDVEDSKDGIISIESMDCTVLPKISSVESGEKAHQTLAEDRVADNALENVPLRRDNEIALSDTHLNISFVKTEPNEQEFLGSANASNSSAQQESEGFELNVNQQILEQLKILNQNMRDSHELKKRSLELEQERIEVMKLKDAEDNKQAYIHIELKRKELEINELRVKGLCAECTVKKETN